MRYPTQTLQGRFSQTLRYLSACLSNPLEIAHQAKVLLLSRQVWAGMALFLGFSL